MLLQLIRKYYPYLLIIATNSILDFLFQKSYKIIYAPWDVLIFSMICYKMTGYLKNKYNVLISRFWVVFFFLGIINMNSVIVHDTTWDVDIHGASLLYFLNIFIFTGALLYFDAKGGKEAKKTSSLDFRIDNKIFIAFFFVFPILLLLTLYKSVGFFPILSGANFVDEMYTYDYGPLYGYKFFCVYSFLMVVYFIKFKKYRLFNIFFLIILLFTTSVDGKRFLLFICLLAFIPLNDYINRLKNPFKKTSYTPVFIVSTVIAMIYMVLLAIRLGNNDVSQWANIFIEKIPFGVEYKDYVYSYEKFNNTNIQNYNFMLSNIGAFVNSGILSFMGYDKEALTHMGSAYVWMDAYNIEFGIRTGIVSELYFAYGIAGSLLMILLAFFVNKTSNKLIRPNSIFELFQHAILYALYVLIINGQATVFFGCLSMMLYIYLFKVVVYGIFKRKRYHIYPDPSVQPN